MKYPVVAKENEVRPTRLRHFITCMKNEKHFTVGVALRRGGGGLGGVVGWLGVKTCWKAVAFNKFQVFDDWALP